MRAQPLHGERGLGLGAVPREPFADQAQLERRHLAAEHSAQQPVLAERAHERPVELPGRPLPRERGELIPGERLRVAQQLGVLRGEVGVGGYAITAVATSSTRAASSNSALTPSRAIAG
jgi:hypothetical protein